MGLGVYDVCEAPLVDLKWTSEHFVGLPATMSPQSLAVVRPPSGPAQLLVASSNTLFLVHCGSSGELVKQLLDVPCLGGTSEMTSVGAHVDPRTGDLLYAFTASSSKLRDDAPSYSLHIHEGHGRCAQVALPTPPHQLLYSTVPSTGGEQGVWVVGGAQVSVVGPSMVVAEDTPPGGGEDLHTYSPVPDRHLDPSDDVQAVLCPNEDEDQSDDEEEDEDDEDDEKDDDDDDVPEEYREDDAPHSRERGDVSSATDVFPSTKCRSPLRKRGADRGSRGAERGLSAGGGATEKKAPAAEAAPHTTTTTSCRHRYRLLSTPLLFPELASLDYNVVRIDTIRTPDGSRRITAACGEDGSVSVFDVSLEEPCSASPPSCYVTAEGSFLKGDTDALNNLEAFLTPAADAPSDFPSISTPKLAVHPNSAPSKRSLGSIPGRSHRAFLPSVSPCQQRSRDQDSFELDEEPAHGAGSPASLELVRAYRATVVSERKFKFEFPMSSVKLFRMNDPREPYPDSLPPLKGVRDPSPDARTPLYSLLATSAVSRSYVLQHVLDETQLWTAPLPQSSDHDTVVCCLSAQLGGDRRRHLLLGTYGQTVLVYTLGPDDGSSSDEDGDGEGAREGVTWQLVTRLQVGGPVLGLALEDVLGDGVGRLVVLTADGVQVFCLEPQQVAAVLTQRLHQLLQTHSSPGPPAADVQAATRSLNF